MATHFIRPEWSAPVNVKAISTLRTGGHSEGAYNSMNLGLHVGDKTEAVLANRDSLSVPKRQLWLQQTHSNKILRFNNNAVQNTEADGSFTTEKFYTCVVMTADCLPVLLTDTHGSFVAALHCGWRGLAGNIVENCVQQMRTEFNASSDIIAWLGPAIGPEAFEVGVDVVEAFPLQNEAFSAKPNGKYMADIFAIATAKLNALGVTQVFSSNLCTYSEPQRFFSYRRDGQTGRMATLIWLE